MALAALELTLQTRLALNAEIYLPLPFLGTKVTFPAAFWEEGILTL